MQKKERFQDWLFRYQYVYRLRRTHKQKTRFISAVIADILPMREDVQVIEYNQQKRTSSRNIYIGDVENAERVVCTYYDTPPRHVGAYTLFQRKEQAKATTKFILLGTVSLIFIGLMATIVYLMKHALVFDVTTFSTWLVIAVFASYFYFLGKVTQGLSNRKNLVRNTSSILTLLAMMEEPDEKTAYALIDEGCFGEQGVTVLQSVTKRNCEVYLLDSVGAKAPLRVLGTPKKTSEAAKKAGIEVVSEQLLEKQPMYLFSGENQAETTGFYLSREVLDQKELNMENIVKVMTFFKRNEPKLSVEEEASC